MSLPIGLFGDSQKYQNIRFLGDGSFGKVYECRDSYGNRFACKWIPKKSKFLYGTETEIRILNAIRDRAKDNRCIQLIDHFEHEDWICMITPLMGLDLYKAIEQLPYRSFKYDKIRDIAKQILESVEFLHLHSIIHTDLKPENILFQDASASQICLIDFGNSVMEWDYHPLVITTQYYRAPEVLLKRNWTSAVDIWSIGCILFELYTGSILFQTDDNAEHLHMMQAVLGPVPVCMHTEKYVEYQRRVVRILPNTSIKKYFMEDHHLLSDLIEKMLVYEPEKRITASEALKHAVFT